MLPNQIKPQENLDPALPNGEKRKAKIFTLFSAYAAR